MLASIDTPVILRVREAYKAHLAMATALDNCAEVLRTLPREISLRPGAGEYEWALADFELVAHNTCGWNVLVAGEIGSKLETSDRKLTADCSFRVIRGMTPFGSINQDLHTTGWLQITRGKRGQIGAELKFVPDYRLPKT